MQLTSAARNRRSSRIACSVCQLLLTNLILAVTATGQAQDVAARFTQATQSMRAGKLEDAIFGFEDVIKHQPSFAEAHFNLGLAYEELGKYEEAIASFRTALRLKPQLRGANLFLGISEFCLNDFDPAAAAIKKEITSSPKDASAWMWLGLVRLRQDRPEDAAEALDKATQLKPNDPDILYHRGRAHLMVSKNSYAQMFKVDPNSWLVHRVLAEANSEADHHADAITEYELAIKLAPTQPGLHEELGSEYLQVNKLAEAELALRQELEINPHNVLAIYKLGVLEVDKHEGAKGKELIEQAQREKPNLVHLEYNLGRAEMLLGNDEAAISHFERAVTTDSDAEVIAQAWYQMGTAFRHLQRLDEARNAMATYQLLKDESARKSQETLDRFRVEHPNAAEADAVGKPDPKQ